MRIGLGTAQFGLPYGITNTTGQVGRDESIAILELAERSGIDTLDTASAYGDGEAMLGAAATSPFRIVSKAPAQGSAASAQEARRNLRAAFLRSLQNLRRPGVYGLLLHHSADLLGPFGPELWQEMEWLKEEGLVTAIGGSFYEGAEIDRALDRYPLDLVQLPFNPLDQRLVVGGQLRRLSKAGVEIHARSLFLQGLLLQLPDRLPARFAPLGTAVGRMRSAFEDAGLTTLEGILAVAFQRDEIGRFICGVTSVAELEQIVAAADKAQTLGKPIDFTPPDGLDVRLLNPSRWDELGA